MQTWFYEKEKGIAILTRSSADACSAVNSSLLLELDKMIDVIACDPQVRVLIITGGTIDGDIWSGSELDPLRFEQFLFLLNHVINKLERLPKPKIAVIDGRAFSLFFELILACDIRLATQNSLLGQQNMNLSAIPGGKGLMRLTRLLGAGRANVVTLTGEIIAADKAMEYGLVNQLVPEDNLLEEAKKVAGQILFQSSGTKKSGQDRLTATRLPVNHREMLPRTALDVKLSPELAMDAKIVFLESWKKTNRKF